MVQADVDDVAAALLVGGGPMTAMKLQKLAYYVQAWHLVHTCEPAFDEIIEAWVEGPVVRRLFVRHRRQRWITSWPAGDAAHLPSAVRAVVAEVLRRYGSLSAKELSEMSHREAPWRQARGGIPDDIPSSRAIDRESMRGFYARVLSQPERAVDDVIASSRLEGGSTSAEQRAILVRVVEGRASAEEAVRRIASSQR